MSPSAMACGASGGLPRLGLRPKVPAQRGPGRCAPALWGQGGNKKHSFGLGPSPNEVTIVWASPTLAFKKTARPLICFLKVQTCKVLEDLSHGHLGVPSRHTPRWSLSNDLTLLPLSSKWIPYPSNETKQTFVWKHARGTRCVRLASCQVPPNVVRGNK
jgi:hypothetical protein